MGVFIKSCAPLPFSTAPWFMAKFAQVYQKVRLWGAPRESFVRFQLVNLHRALQAAK